MTKRIPSLDVFGPELVAAANQNIGVPLVGSEDSEGYEWVDIDIDTESDAHMYVLHVGARYFHKGDGTVRSGHRVIAGARKAIPAKDALKGALLLVAEQDGLPMGVTLDDIRDLDPVEHPVLSLDDPDGLFSFDLTGVDDFVCPDVDTVHVWDLTLTMDCPNPECDQDWEVRFQVLGFQTSPGYAAMAAMGVI